MLFHNIGNNKKTEARAWRIRNILSTIKLIINKYSTSDEDEKVQLFEQAGRNFNITPISDWMASFTDEELENIMKEYPDLKDDWDDKYGDRINQLVLIGKNYRKQDILNSILECLEN